LAVRLGGGEGIGGGAARLAGLCGGLTLEGYWWHSPSAKVNPAT